MRGRRYITLDLRRTRGGRRELSRKTLAALGATTRKYVAATDRRHAMAKAVPALAHEFARLVGAFHVVSPSIRIPTSSQGKVIAEQNGNYHRPTGICAVIAAVVGVSTRRLGQRVSGNRYRRCGEHALDQGHQRDATINEHRRFSLERSDIEVDVAFK